MISLLATDEMMKCIPSDVEVKFNWGPLLVCSNTPSQKDGEGTHIAIEGSEESIKDWLRPFGRIWIGVGSPIFQEFELREVLK